MANLCTLGRISDIVMGMPVAMEIPYLGNVKGECMMKQDQTVDLLSDKPYTIFSFKCHEFHPTMGHIEG